MDAAFDAFPAVEATAEAIDRAIGEDDPTTIDLRDEPDVIVIQETPRRGILRRLLRR
jgi:hypothetical protein